MHSEEILNSNNTVIQFEEEVQQVFPNLKDKLIIDYINGLDAAQDLNKKNKASHGFIKRNIELLSGVNKLRQEAVNDHVIVGLEACHEHLMEMSSHMQQHSYAMIQLKKALNTTQSQISEVVDFICDFKKAVDQQFNVLSEQIDELNSHRKAVSHMDNILSRWCADKFISLSPLGQCFCVLDNLKWGDFGSYLHYSSNETEKNRLLETLENKVIKIQKDILRIDLHTDISRSKWIEAPSESLLADTLSEVLQYQGNQSLDNPSKYPMVFTATQLPFLESSEKDEYSHLTRRRLDIDRVSRRMMNEIFRSTP